MVETGKITYDNGLEGLLNKLLRCLSHELFLVAARFFPTLLLLPTTNQGALQLPTKGVLAKDGDGESGTENQKSCSYRGNVLVAVPGYDTMVKDRIMRYLKGKGYRATTASSGEELLNKVDSCSLDAIVASTQLENEMNAVKGIFQKVYKTDELLPTVFLTLATPQHLEFAANYPSSAGAIRLNELRANDSKLIDLGKSIERAIKAARSYREIFYNTIQNHWSEIQKTDLKDELSLEASPEIGAWMRYIYFRMPESKGLVVRYTDDSAVGVSLASQYSGIELRKIYAPVDKKKNYSTLQPLATIIKQAQSKPAFDRYLDDYLEYSTTTSNSSDGLRLPKPLKYHYVNDGVLLIMYQTYIAPTNAKLMGKLDKGTELDRAIIKAIVDVSLEKSIQWFNRTKQDIDFSEKSMREMVELYTSRIGEIIEHFEEWSNIKLGQETRQAFAEEMLNNLDIIREHNSLLGRIIDNSPYNSGLELYILDPSREEIISGLTKGKNLHDTIRRTWSIWDQYSSLNEDGKVKPRHLFEDFFQMVDSYEAKLTNSEKMNSYISFMKTLMPDYFHKPLSSYFQAALHNRDVELNKYWKDFFTIAVFKNLRKQDFIAHVYAQNNRRDWAYFRIDEELFIQKERGYTMKWEHPSREAAKYAAVGAAFLSNGSYQGRKFSDNAEDVLKLMNDYDEGRLDPEKYEQSPMYIVASEIAKLNPLHSNARNLASVPMPILGNKFVY